jgi:3-oxoadipate enol-lactonase
MQSNGIALNYRWDGPVNGPVVVLSHSLGADLTMWEPQVTPLTAAGYRLLRYDHRGHGGSAAPEGPYTIDQLTADAVGLLDALGLERVHFCGLSMGGMVGQVLGARYGHRLNSLTLCSTSSHMPPPEVWNERIQLVGAKGLAAVVDATIDRWFTQPGQQRLPVAIGKIRATYLQTPVSGFLGCCVAIRDLDLRETILTITTPTLILVGEHDQGTPVSHARFIHERIPTSRLVVIPDAAHLQNVEQAEIFNQTLLTFIEEHRKGP